MAMKKATAKKPVVKKATKAPAKKAAVKKTVKTKKASRPMVPTVDTIKVNTKTKKVVKAKTASATAGIRAIVGKPTVKKASKKPVAVKAKGKVKKSK